MSVLYIPLRDVIEYNSWAEGKRLDPGRDGYEQVLVRGASSRDVLALEQELMQRGFQVYSQRQQVEELSSFFVTLQAIFGGIGAIALLVAAFGIANTMSMATLERTREIGLMKAVRASNKDVMIVFLGESGGIGLLGGLGGVLLGLVLNLVLNLVGQSMQRGRSRSSERHCGDSFSTPCTREQLESARRCRQEVGARWERLTGRERDVARLVAEGGTNREIALDLENLPTV